MSTTFDSRLHPRGGNPSNLGQWSTKSHSEADTATLAVPAAQGGGTQNVYELARTFDADDIGQAEANAAQITGRGYWSAVEQVRTYDPDLTVDGELDSDSTDDYVEVHAFDSQSEMDDWLHREGFYSDVEQVDRPDIDYATEPYDDPGTGRREERSLSTWEPDPAIPDSVRDQYQQQHLDTMLWSELDEDGEPLEGTYTSDDVDSGAQLEAQADLDDFVEANNPLLTRLATEHPDYDLSQLPHDFHLSRNGHGAGFWDRGLGEVGDQLHQATRPYGSFELQPGDDGNLYAA